MIGIGREMHRTPQMAQARQEIEILFAIEFYIYIT